MNLCWVWGYTILHSNKSKFIQYLHWKLDLICACRTRLRYCHIFCCCKWDTVDKSWTYYQTSSKILIMRETTTYRHLRRVQQNKSPMQEQRRSSFWSIEWLDCLAERSVSQRCIDLELIVLALINSFLFKRLKKCNEYTLPLLKSYPKPTYL